MAESLKVLGQACPNANAPAALYTVPALKSAVLSKMTICNQNTATAKVLAWVGVAGAGTDVKQYIAYNMLVLAGFPPADIMAGFALGAGDVIHVQSDIGGVSFNATGSEVG